MIVRFFTTTLPHWLCGAPPPPLRLRAANVPENPNEEEIEEDDEMSTDFTVSNYTVEMSTRHLRTSTKASSSQQQQLPGLLDSSANGSSETSSSTNSEEWADTDDDSDFDEDDDGENNSTLNNPGQLYRQFSV